jgi:hypothetical protein
LFYRNGFGNHAERLDFILDAQKIHKALGLIKEALDDSGSSTILMPPQNHQVVYASTMKVKVLICGRLSYISGPVGEKGQIEKWKMPNITFPSTLLPHEHGCTISRRWKKHLHRACGLKVVPSLSAEKSNISFGKVVPRVWEMSEISPAGSTIHSEQVLQFARFAVLESSVGNCQLAIGESGLIFFVRQGRPELVVSRVERSPPQVNVIGRL